jgi:hypothetical protein
MAKTKDNLLVTATDLESLRTELNFLFQRIADRLDAMEGIRGEASIENSMEVTDEDGNVIHSLE